MFKIGVVGPESTGKSEICNSLALYYNTNYLPEYAREYLKGRKGYTYEDILNIAKQSLKIRDTFFEENRNKTLIFIDTDFYVLEVWSEYVFESCHDFILKNVATQNFDLYLLMNIDLAWEYDVLREHPGKLDRLKIFNTYLAFLSNQKTPFTVISGFGEMRIHNAIKCVNSFYLQKKLTEKIKL